MRRGLLALVLLFAATAAWADTRRVAVVVGNNAGTGEQPPLRYAENDAGKMARVLVELGDVSADDLLLLQGRRLADVERAIVDARDRIAAYHRSPDTRTLLLFYFSGHSDGESLELGKELLSYARLKAMLLGTGAELRVVVIDACKSGSAIAQKGGRPAAPFTLKLTDALSATGEAFIASSAADEAALESAEVMGSFFTHHLISGLRGAADSSGDRLVTLGEAYRYAYDRTVAATALTPAGQHPSYDYRLSGQGELVLSTLVRPSASLVLPEGADRSLVSDLTRDQVVVELPPFAAREVALAPGLYGIRLVRAGQSYGGRVQLAEGSHHVVRWEELTLLSSSVVLANKGGEVREVWQPRPPPSGRGISLLAAAGHGVAEDLAVSYQLRLSFEPQLGRGWLFALVGTRGALAGFTESSAQARAGYFWSAGFGPLWVSGGAEAALCYLWQRSEAWGMAQSLAPGLVPRVMVRLPLGDRFALTAEGELSLVLLRIADRLSVAPLPFAGLGGSYLF